MARTELPVTALNANNLTANGAGTTGTTDGHFVDTNTRNAINDPVQAELLLLEATVTTGTTNVTVKAGNYPPALASNIGDLVAACPVGVTKLGPFESGRFLRNDGTIWIDYATPANVTIRAFRIPRNV